MECSTLWGEPERVHVQNMEQLHDCIPERDWAKPQATVYETKSTEMHNTESGSSMVQQACHACCVWSTLRLLSRRLLWHAIALIDVTIGEVGPCDEWLPLWVATQIMASTDETFLSCGSPYRSSHWIGRSTSGLCPCCCHWWFVSSR